MSREIFFYPMVIINVKRKKETVWVKKVTQNQILSQNIEWYYETH